MKHEVNSCEECPASYLKMQSNNFGCGLRRGIVHPCDSSIRIPSGCPLLIEDQTLTLKQL